MAQNWHFQKNQPPLQMSMIWCLVALGHPLNTHVELQKCLIITKKSLKKLQNVAKFVKCGKVCKKMDFGTIHLPLSRCVFHLSGILVDRILIFKIFMYPAFQGASFEPNYNSVTHLILEI